MSKRNYGKLMGNSGLWPAISVYPEFVYRYAIRLKMKSEARKNWLLYFHAVSLIKPNENIFYRNWVRHHSICSQFSPDLAVAFEIRRTCGEILTRQTGFCLWGKFRKNFLELGTHQKFMEDFLMTQNVQVCLHFWVVYKYLELPGVAGFFPTPWFFSTPLAPDFLLDHPVNQGLVTFEDRCIIQGKPQVLWWQGFNKTTA